MARALLALLVAAASIGLILLLAKSPTASAVAIRLTAVLLALGVGVALLVVFRVFSNSPTELERLGNDFALLGWGTGVFLWIKSGFGYQIASIWVLDGTFLLPLAFIVTVACYLSTLRWAHDIRSAYEALDDSHLFLDLYRNKAEGVVKSRFRWSVVIGFAPAFIFGLLDLWVLPNG